MSAPTVLVVDDDDDLRGLAALVLEHAGFLVHTAPSGAEALALLDRTGMVPSLIVLDVQMPDLDGWDTLVAIRRRPPVQDVPVILCTVRSQPSDAERGWVLGCDGYLRKPFAIDELASQALAVVDRSPAERETVRLAARQGGGQGPSERLAR